MKKVSLLAASVAIALTGCGGGSDSGSGTPIPGGIVITAIDGYLVNAEVWVDTNEDLVIDHNDKKLDETTDENGQFTLPSEYKDHAVFIKAIANQTVDKTRGLVTTSFELAATAGSTTINPMTNMVVEQLEADKALTQEEAEKNVVESITDSGLSVSDALIFGDYIAESTEEAAALNVIGETLVDHSNLSVEKQLELTDAIATETKKVIDDPEESLDDFSPVVEIPENGGAPIVTPNSRPVHNQQDNQLDSITLMEGDVWTVMDASTYFNDTDGDELTYELIELTGKLNGLSIHPTLGLISGHLKEVGTFNYQIFAQDEHLSLSYPLNLQVTLESPNIAPVLDEAEKTSIQLEVDEWQLQEGEKFSQTIDISNLFEDEDGSIQGITVGLGGVVPGLSSDTDLESLQVTISGTPDRAWDQKGKLTISVKDNDNAMSKEALFFMPHVLEGTPVEPPAPKLGFTEAHFNNQEWKMGSFAANDGEIGYASLVKDEMGLMFCWGSNSDKRYSSNISDSNNMSESSNISESIDGGYEYAPFVKLAQLDQNSDYMSHQDKDCLDVTITDGKLIDEEGSSFEMLYQNNPSQDEYQMVLKVNQDELFWLDSTSDNFAQTLPVADKVKEGFIDFDLMVEKGEIFNPELDGYPLTYAAGQFKYADSTYEYQSIKPTGFYTPGNLSYVLDDAGREGLELEETGKESDFKTRYRYIQREFGDFYIAVKWSEEKHNSHVSAPEFGLYSYNQEAMEKIINQLPLLQD